MPSPKPIVVQLAQGVYAINEFGLDSIFVIEGSKSALVIDLGIGCCDLKSIIEDITKLPYEIVLTHGHLDHVDYTDYRALPASVLDDAIGACRAALAPDGHRYHTDGKVVFRSVTLEYEQGWAELEPHSPYPLGL